MIWIKDNGKEIELNDEKATIEKAKSLGWKKVEEKKKAGRPKKEKTEENTEG